MQKATAEVPYFRYGNSPKNLVFCHGYGLSPRHYHTLLSDISSDATVHCLEMYGCNNLKKNPSSLEENVQLTLDTLAGIPELKGSFSIAGHSMGANVAMMCASESSLIDRVAIINPIVPLESRMGPITLVRRMLLKTYSQLLGLDNGRDGFRFAKEASMKTPINFLRDLKASISLIKDISYVGNLKVEQPVLGLLGMDDRLFDYGHGRRYLEDSCRDIRIKTYLYHTHDWPIFRPKDASVEIKEFLGLV